MTVSAFQWGTNFENTIRIGFPLFEVVTDREERDGSEHIQGSSGIEDSWITGRDYVLDTEVRWIPDGPGTAPVQTALSGAVGWQEFLDWARDANAFRFVPDETEPNFYLDNTYLVEPRQGFGSLSADIKRNVRLKLRNATMDFHQALRGIMFEYAPGADVSVNGSNLAVTTSAGRFLGVTGIVQGAAANTLRDRHYDAMRRTTLFEETRANLILQSEDLRTNGEGNPTVAWTAVNTTLTADATTAPDGAVTADKVVETATTAVHSRLQTVTITAGRIVVVSGFFKAAERSQFFLNIFNGADGLNGAFDTAGSGTATPINVGAGVVKLIRLVAVPGLPGWWYFWISGIVNAGATAIACEFALRKAGTNSYLGTLTEGAYLWGCQAEQVSVVSGSGQCAPAFYIPTTTATVTRTGDLVLKAWPYAKQAMWFYARFIETGIANSTAPGGTLPDVVAIGSFGANLRTEMTGGSTGNYGFSHGNSVTTRSSGVTLTPVVGDLIELLGVVYGDDSVQLFGRKNGGSTTVGSRSSAGVATPEYGYKNLQIAGENGIPIGLIELQALKVGAGEAVLTIPAAAAA